MTESIRSYRRLPDDSRPSPRPRILVISHLYPHPDLPHAGIFVREQVEALSAEADVTVLVGRYGLEPHASGVRTGRAGVQVIEVGLPWPRWLPSVLRIAVLIPAYRRAALRIARHAGDRFDVIHAHFGLPDGVVGVLVGRALSVPVVVTMHGADFSRQLNRLFLGRLAGRALSRADRIIGVSQHIADGMKTAFGLGDDRVMHIANGYNDEDIAVHAQRDPRYFLFVGSLIKRKNPDLLLEAFAAIAPRTDLDLVILGDGPMMDDLRHRVGELGLGSRVRLGGQVDHATVGRHLGEAAALVLPSTSEGMPIIVNEALASGTPVVATRLPGIEQQVRSDEFGILVPVGDVETLSDALVDASSRNWDYGLIARDSAVLTWGEYADRLLQVYRDLHESD